MRSSIELTFAPFAGTASTSRLAAKTCRLLDEALLEELVGELRVRGGEDVGLGARADLRGELVGAGERELDVGAVELLAVVVKAAFSDVAAETSRSSSPDDEPQPASDAATANAASTPLMPAWVS